MKKTLLMGVTLLLSASVFPLHAQRDNRKESGVTTIINGINAGPNDSIQVENTFKHNAPETPNDNGLPRFALIGKDRAFYLGIGAQFLGEGVYSWGADVNSPVDFTPSAFTPSAPGNEGSTQFAWQTSSFYLNFVAMPGSNNQLGLFIKLNFTGANNDINLAHVYAKYRGLTIGKTNSAFTDGAAMPMTIDNEGPNGYPDMSLFTAYWHQDFTKNISGAIGIDAPSAELTEGNSTKFVNQRIPAVPLYLQYAWAGGNSHVRLSGIVRPLEYRDMAKGENRSITGGGIQLSGVTGIVGNLGGSLNAAYGSGIASYFQDDNGLNLDAVAVSETGNMKPVKTFGVTGGLTYSFSPKVSSNVSYSHLVNWLPDGALQTGDMYRYGDYLAANVIWTVNKFISAGVEYDYGHRKHFDGSSLHANRLQAQFALTF